jgi:hypothetical protein
MRFLKVVGIILTFFALMSVAIAAGNDGIRDSYKINFDQPIRIGQAVLPAGDYTIRHTMEGQDHVMVFQARNGKTPEVKAKCTLVPLPKKADQTSKIYSVNAANERVLQELVFSGDTQKHVF